MRNTVRLNKDGMTANIMCDRQNGTQELVRVDIADLGKLAKLDVKWSIGQTNPTNQYCMAMFDGNRIYCHRFLMGFPDGMEIDHIDGNGLNNTRKNLQIIDRQGNAAKMRLSCKPRRNNQLGLRGVTRTRNGRYQVSFQNKYVATYNTAEHASKVYELLRVNVNIARTGRP